MTLIHASCVALSDGGVLLRGPAGGGKSDLALRLIDGGAVLVADDQVALTARDGALFAAPPETIAGKIEARGIGIMNLPHDAEARVALVIDLVRPDRVERIPEPARCRYLGIELPLLALAPFEASAPAKVRLAVGAARRDSSRRP